MKDILEVYKKMKVGEKWQITLSKRDGTTGKETITFTVLSKGKQKIASKSKGKILGIKVRTEEENPQYLVIPAIVLNVAKYIKPAP